MYRGPISSSSPWPLAWRSQNFLAGTKQKVHTGRRKIAAVTLCCGAACMTRTLLIDTDTASDDAVALIMALRSSEVRVAAITVVAGNVPVSQAVSNALFTAELCGSHVPVSSAAEAPALRNLPTPACFDATVPPG